MADEVDYGVARVRIELDESAIDADARIAGQRIQQALDKATKKLGRRMRRQIQQGLAAGVSVAVLPDLDDFDRSMRAQLRGRQFAVTVAPDMADFEDALRDGLPDIDSLTVDVLPDMSGFEARLRAGLPDIDALVVDVVPDLLGFEAVLRAGLPDIEAIEVPVVPDLTGFEAALRAGLPSIADLEVGIVPDFTRLDAAVRGHKLPQLPVDIIPDLDALDRAVRGHKLPQLPLDLIIDLDRIDRALRGHKFPQIPIDLRPDMALFVARIREYLRGRRVSIRVVPDFTRFDAAVRAHNVPDIDINVSPNVDQNGFSRALSSLLGIASGVGKALAGLLAFGAVGIAAAGAAAGVTALVAALAPAAGIIAALPAAVIGAQVALGTLKLALIGVEDAFSAALTGSTEEFEKALEKLSPAAQKAARVVREFRPELKALQQAVQQSFFSQFSGDIRGAIKNLLPLQKGLQGIAAQFGKAASEGLKFAASKDAVTPLKAILQGVEDASSGLSVAIAPISKGFLDIAAAVSTAFGKGVGERIGQVGAQFGTYLSGLAASGKAVEQVSAAVKVFRQLGEILGNLKGAFDGIRASADNVGAGLLDRLTAITQGIENFTKSAAGQESIGSIFQTTQDIATELGPILQALVIQIGGIGAALSPIFSVLGPGLVNLVNALGPGIAALAPGLQSVALGLAGALAVLEQSGALEAFGNGLSLVLTALSPLLPLAGQLAAALGVTLGAALENLAILFGPIIQALSQSLGPVLPQIADAFVRLAEALRPLAEQLGGALGGAIAQILPGLILLIPKIIDEMVPAVERLTEVLTPLIPKFVDLAVRGILPILPHLPGLIEQFGQLALKLVDLGAQFGPPLEKMLEFAAALLEFVATEQVVRQIESIIGALQLLTSAISFVISVTSRVIEGLISPFRTVYNVLVGNSIIPDLINAIIRYFTSLPGRIRGALGGLVSSVASSFRQAGASAISAITSFIGRAVALFRSLPGKARAALGSAKSALVSAGRDLIAGMISGVRSAAGSLASAARDVVGDAVSAAKSALGISSPSKVFAEIGRDTGKGFIKGLLGTAAEIERTTKKLIDDITKAFKGKKTKLDDRLVSFVESQNKKLLTLAKQRDGLIAQLTDARKFAADVAKSAEGAFSLSSITESGNVTVKSITDGLRAGIEAVQNFRVQVAALAKRGLRSDLLRQVIGLGPEKGAEIAAVLARQSKASLKQINSLQRDLSIASETLGEVSADALFDSGKKAGDGFLAGLKARRKDIEKLMLDIAKGMQASIRAALKIRSPSQVFAKIGDQTGQGLERGLLASIGGLEDELRAAAEAIAAAVAGQFDGLPATIAASLGSLGSRVLAQIRSGLPSSARSLLPGFADGGIIDHPMIAALGEGGKREVVIPLTRPQRARQLAEQSGLNDVLGGAGMRADKGRKAPQAASSVVHNHTWNLHEVGNAEATAHRVVNRFVLAVGL